MQLVRPDIHLQLGFDAALEHEPLTHGVQRCLSLSASRVELRNAASCTFSIVHFTCIKRVTLKNLDTGDIARHYKSSPKRLFTSALCELCWLGTAQSQVKLRSMEQSAKSDRLSHTNCLNISMVLK